MNIIICVCKEMNSRQENKYLYGIVDLMSKGWWGFGVSIKGKKCQVNIFWKKL